MRRALLLLPLAFAACFGSGGDPTPGPNTNVLRPLYSAPPAAYVRQAIVDGGRLIVLTELPQNGPSTVHAGAITSVPVDGSAATKIADLTDAEGMLASDGQSLFFATQPQGAFNDIYAVAQGDGGALAKLGSSPITGSSVGGIVVTPTAIYFANVIPGPTLLDVPSSTGGGPPSNGGNPGALFVLDRAALKVTQLFPPTSSPMGANGISCSTSKTCLWSDSGSLYFARMPNSGKSALSRMTPPSTAVTDLASFDQNTLLTGVAFDASSVYWAQVDATGTCSVMRVPKMGGAPVTVATLPTAPCRDLAVDGGFVYTTTLGLLYANDPGGPTRGNGIARAPIAGGSFAITPLERDDWWGATRLEIDDTTVYAVSPNLILAIPKTLLQ